MPVYNGNTILPQIYSGNNKIYRVFKGNELVHGIFNTYYNVGPGSVSPTSQEFTWGIGLSSLPTPSCNEATFNGWYSDKSLNSQISNISTTISTDMNLYAYFEKQKVQYAGNYQWETYEKIKDEDDEKIWHEGSSGGSSFTPLSPGWHYNMYSGNDCWAWCSARHNMLGDHSHYGMWDTPSTSYTPKAGALARWGTSEGNIKTAIHGAFVEKVYDDGTPLYSHGRWGKASDGMVYVTTSSGLDEIYKEYYHLGYIYTSICDSSGGGSSGYWETIHHDAEYGYVTHTGYVDWQDSSSPPQGDWSSGSPSTRTVYSHWDYNSNSWTSWSTK